MNSTAVMTDTNSGISVSEGLEKDIFVLPMPVIVDGKDLLEGSTISHKALYAAMKDGKDIKSSQPSLGNVTEMWDVILSKGYKDIIYIPMSSGLSGSCLTASAAASEYGGKVAVADNHRISVTLRASVLDAKHLADSGMNAAEIKQRLADNAFNSVVYLAVSTLEYFKKSGRITAAAAAVATVLNIKPVLVTHGEKFDTFAKIRGVKASREKIIEAMKNEMATTFSGYDPSRIRIGTAGSFEDPAEAGEWKKAVQNSFPGYEVYYNDLSCSIVCHTGMAAAGAGISVIDRG